MAYELNSKVPKDLKEAFKESELDEETKEFFADIVNAYPWGNGKEEE